MHIFFNTFFLFVCLFLFSGPSFHISCSWKQLCTICLVTEIFAFIIIIINAIITTIVILINHLVYVNDCQPCRLVLPQLLWLHIPRQPIQAYSSPIATSLVQGLAQCWAISANGKPTITLAIVGAIAPFQCGVSNSAILLRWLFCQPSVMADVAGALGLVVAAWILTAWKAALL